MEKVLGNGFCEMTENEVVQITGGWNWGTVIAGTGLVVACIALTVGTGGIGACSLPLILGAGTTTEIVVAGTALVGSAIGGGAIGYGATH